MKNHKPFAVALLLTLVSAGCSWLRCDETPDRPVRAALYVGKGASGVGLYRWLELTTFAKGMETTLVDAEAIRGGALDGKDVLIMPCGVSWTIAAELGANGAARVSGFVRGGGGYVGTCAGAFLVSAPSETHAGMLGLIPFTSRAGHGNADMMVRFNSRAEAVAGICKGTHRIAYAGGPVLTPTLPVRDSEYEILGTYDSNINTWTARECESMAGQAAVVAGRCGKGRIFVSAVHPECDADDHYVIRGALRFLTGREIEWSVPQRRRGQLTVGIDMANGFGSIAAATRMRELMRGGEFDLLPVNEEVLASGMCHHLDSVIAPTNDGFASLERLQTLPFAAYGTVVEKPWNRKRVKVAVYTDKGGANFSIADRLALSAGFEVKVMDGKDIASGALNGMDMLLQPGGWSPSQYEALGTNGIAEIKRFVREGGSYYGLCAGAFVASETLPGGKPRGDMLPWKDIGEPTYRGWGPIRVKITEEGMKYLGNSQTNRYVTYWGGPVFEPGRPVEDADVRVWGEYLGYNLCTSSPKPVKPMAGHAAFLGGTVGKGKVFISAPHPEKDERSYDIVLSAIEYLTGLRPDPVSRDRRRGALSVALDDTREKPYAEMYLNSLIRDRRFDVRVNWRADDLKHLDAVVLGSPSADELKGLAEFAENGGAVIAVADTTSRRAAVEGLGWVTVVGSAAEVPAALGKLTACPFTNACRIASAVSPDGYNEILLYANPLGYEVRRDGESVVLPTPIDLELDGRGLAADHIGLPQVTNTNRTGSVITMFYKKGHVKLGAGEAFADFGDWGVRMVARNDGVAWRFETSFTNEIAVTHERAGMTLPQSADCHVAYAKGFGKEQIHPDTQRARELRQYDPKRPFVAGNRNVIYPPFVFKTGNTVACAVESDVWDYPVWDFARTSPAGATGPVSLESVYAYWPTSVVNNVGVNRADGAPRQRHWLVRGSADYLVKCEGTRTFPWRGFVLADKYAELCENDLVYALARPPAKGLDWSWVRPGKVAWEWWNAFDNIGDPAKKGHKNGCTTATYRRFIDFAARNGIEYVIMDEGWSKKLDIWNFAPGVDVPALIEYGRQKGVGIILWMAWAQVEGDEERVAEHFAKLGVKGFKVDFMDRGDAQVERFLWKFADVCARHHLLVDWHGAHRPTGQNRAYPNVINYEAVHGLEVMKFYDGHEDFMDNDVKAFFVRMTAGPMDYTPGAMRNFPRDLPSGAKGPADFRVPGSFGTRCHQIALMSMFEAPLQMLCDSPTNYEANQECLDFIAKTPVTWRETVGLGGTPDTYAAVARRAAGNVWWAAAITNWEPRELTLDTDFLGEGEWRAEIFRDAVDSAKFPTHYVREYRNLMAGDKLRFYLAPGGGFAIQFKPAVR